MKIRINCSVGVGDVVFMTGYILVGKITEMIGNWCVVRDSYGLYRTSYIDEVRLATEFEKHKYKLEEHELKLLRSNNHV